MRGKIEARLSATDDHPPSTSAPDLNQVNAILERFNAQLHDQIDAHLVHVQNDPAGAGLVQANESNELGRESSIETSRAVVSGLIQKLHATASHHDLELNARMHQMGQTLNALLQGLKKHGGNYLVSLARDGSITTATTMLRELIAYAVVKNSTLNETQKAAIAGGVLGFAVALNLMAMLSHRLKGIGNTRTRIGQATNIVLLGAVTYIAKRTGTLAAVMPLLVKAASYSLMRDSTNDFVTLSDRRDTSGMPPSIATAFKNAPLYAAISIIVNYLQGSAVAMSGAGAAGKGVDLLDALGPILAYSFFNGLGEAADGADISYLIANEQSRAVQAAGAHGAEARQGTGDVEMAINFRVPNLDQYTDKVTGAMTGRFSAFSAIFGMIGALSLVPMSADKQAHFMNCVVGLTIGAFVPIFMAGFSTSPPPVRPLADPSPV